MKIGVTRLSRNGTVLGSLAPFAISSQIVTAITSIILCSILVSFRNAFKENIYVFLEVKLIDFVYTQNKLLSLV
jgi:hypothetical protein